ncbi:beta-1,2-xylosyltransferase XYXT1-like [Phragmites australis]|uniref:beta-1,2-xylosyltransferase XYXT1-like n=1 Tax=Phragmites australis TaxID=29695 RepID=UPI002D7984A2|nr:beta-1,2-xylosyltransferase XYXT1-like [Phragmites australis]
MATSIRELKLSILYGCKAADLVCGVGGGGASAEMKPVARNKKSRGAFCNLPLLLLIGAIQFLVIYSPTFDRYMVMLTTGKPGFPSLLLDGRRGFKLVEDEIIPEPRVRCDFADPRSDVCELEGAIRIRGSTSEVFVITPSRAAGGGLRANVTGLGPNGTSTNATSWRIQPYTRKGEARVMRGVTEMTVRLVTADEAPACTVRHDVPAVVYSNGGYCGNYYHDFNDNIIPLFITSRHLGGEVQLLVAQKQRWWFHKYREIVDGLTNYEAVDLDKEEGGEVRCFRRATVGLRSHKDLSIDPRRAPNNLSMVDFKRFLMWRYALPREHAIRTDEEEEPGRKPRLLIITRRSRRRFVNLPEIVALAEEVGFEVTTSDVMSSKKNSADAAAAASGNVDGDGGQARMAEASALVNSFDAMLAVHGSGLTNLVFLPMNAVVVQVVPLGRMEGLAMDEYGVPPRDMNMRYLQYNITAEESTLSEVFPRGHPVFLDPMPIHKQSWSLVKDIYLGQQDVRLNVRRFSPVLQKAIQFLR